ncbi:protein kinase domain containing protein [Stylonychia lemnae]|uniref:Protein kinase domain containing protein n=1 Tax=Stylonychia lemnae TaxID=5949 RepID=A0A077ZX63_STYLE|nr:protein kinase domain containing protein [Stylonychia lemnae]|eukprot:CDW73832.1 protein kinase domain containing protein [Stylonychia lemnae]
MREIKTFELKHPYIVEFIDSFIDKNNFVSIFELASLSLDKIIASYIEHLHSKRTIHRDISAVNILYFMEQEVFKLADFGVATFGTTYNNAGKQDYMAPEVIQVQTRGYNEKVDIWSMGVVLPTYRPTATEALKLFLEELNDLSIYQLYSEKKLELQKEKLLSKIENGILEFKASVDQLSLQRELKTKSNKLYNKPWKPFKVVPNQEIAKLTAVYGYEEKILVGRELGNIAVFDQNFQLKKSIDNKDLIRGINERAGTDNQPCLLFNCRNIYNSNSQCILAGCGRYLKILCKKNDFTNIKTIDFEKEIKTIILHDFQIFRNALIGLSDNSLFFLKDTEKFQSLEISFGFKLPDNEAKINHACTLRNFEKNWVFVATNKGIYYFLGDEGRVQDGKLKVQIDKINQLGDYFFYSVETMLNYNIAVSKHGLIQIYNFQEKVILKEIDTNGEWSILQNMVTFTLIKTQSKLLLLHFQTFKTIELAKSIHIGDMPSQSLMSIAQGNIRQPIRIIDIQLKRDKIDKNRHISSIRELNFSVEKMEEILTVCKILAELNQWKVRRMKVIQIWNLSSLSYYNHISYLMKLQDKHMAVGFMKL